MLEAKENREGKKMHMVKSTNEMSLIDETSVSINSIVRIVGKAYLCVVSADDG